MTFCHTSGIIFNGENSILNWGRPPAAFLLLRVYLSAAHKKTYLQQPSLKSTLAKLFQNK
jgi:hypothetical protein